MCECVLCVTQNRKLDGESAERETVVHLHTVCRLCVCARASMQECAGVLARACVCVFFFRFTPQELLSFLHRSLIEGRRDQGGGGGGREKG